MFFIQVGSHTGQTANDPVRELIQDSWSGILIEPVKYLFRRLAAFHAGNNRLILENVAIDEKPGKRILYRIDETRLAGLPRYADQLGTLLPEVILGLPFADRVVEEEVECITFDQLFDRHRVDHVDLLAIDAEGMDYVILRSFPFYRIRPRQLRYEVKHLSPRDKQLSTRLIQSVGYTDIVERKGDIHAVLGQ